MTRRAGWIAVLLAVAAPAFAQFDGPSSTGFSSSLIRLFGTNNAFTAQAEFQVLGKDNKERIGTPMTVTLLDNKIRLEVDVTRMRNREHPDASAQVKPLGMDQVISIVRPDQRVTRIVFPKLQCFVTLELPPEEADAFQRKAKLTRTTVAREKMDGHPCLKQRVVITDDAGKKTEATIWSAPDLRDFPICVATKEGADTAVIHFRQIQFVRSDDGKFVPPTGFVEYGDIQKVMAGPVVRYMKEYGTAIKTDRKSTGAKSGAPKPASKPANASPSAAGATRK